jgi:hypothetical protein
MWDTPWWANPNRSPGRYHALGDPPVQYWCTHPLGPAAEFLRWQGPLAQDDVGDVRLRLWAAVAEDDRLVAVDFDNADEFGLDPADLVAEDYGPTQALAQRVRSAGAVGMIVPSAALPGTHVVVMFGPRLLFPYLSEPIDQEQVPTAHVADSELPGEVVARVRWRGAPHGAIEEWSRVGRVAPFVDPPIVRRPG